MRDVQHRSGTKFRRDKRWLIDIVKKGYARDAGQALLLSGSSAGTMPRGSGASQARGMAAVWIGARLPQAPDWVYLDATGLSMAMVTMPRRGWIRARASKARVSAGDLRWALLMRAIKCLKGIPEDALAARGDEGRGTLR
jgi:hypothetical protein